MAGAPCASTGCPLTEPWSPPAPTLVCVATGPPLAAVTGAPGATPPHGIVPLGATSGARGLPAAKGGAWESTSMQSASSSTGSRISTSLTVSVNAPLEARPYGASAPSSSSFAVWPGANR